MGKKGKQKQLINIPNVEESEIKEEQSVGFSASVGKETETYEENGVVYKAPRILESKEKTKWA